LNKLLISEIKSKVKHFTDEIMERHEDIVILFDVFDEKELEDER
tara:strand:- start:2949 stop:3080 length:132 start_codon:yes stop_codon:yes gene_type:complete